MNQKKLYLGIFLLSGMFMEVKAQIGVHADGIYVGTIMGEQYFPKKLRNFGARIGVSYQIHPNFKIDLSTGFYKFSEISRNYTYQYEGSSENINTKIYAQTKGFCIEPSIMLYLVSNVLYLKTGPYFGRTQIPPDSGNVINHFYMGGYPKTVDPFNYTYSTGVDKGLMLGSGLQLFNDYNLLLDFEVLMRFGSVTGTRTESFTGEIKTNYRVSYISYMPTLRLTYQIQTKRK